MTTDETTNAKRIDELERRVAELEAQLSGGGTAGGSGSGSGFDTVGPRDKAVLDQLIPGEDYHPRAILDLYKRKTDISNANTAKRRAKELRRRYFDGYTFVGVDDAK